MAIPDFQQCMRPLLSSLKDGEVHHFNEAYEDVCKHFDVSDDEKRQLLPSGKQTVARNRCGWARTYMKKAGLLLDPKRSHVQITELGLQVQTQKSKQILVATSRCFAYNSPPSLTIILKELSRESHNAAAIRNKKK